MGRPPHTPGLFDDVPDAPAADPRAAGDGAQSPRAGAVDGVHGLADPLDTCFDGVPADWRALTDAFRGSVTGRSLIGRVDARRTAGVLIHPGDVFAALRLTPLDTVQVVVLGQDPYHGAGQAHGLAFSVTAGVRPPPSLRNILQQWHGDLGRPLPPHGDLTAWARRGVLLLNTCLTVEDGQAASHAGWGWEALTDALIQAVARRPSRKVFMLWGAHAQRKAPIIEAAGDRHLILQSNHPSPLSARRGPVPFIGCGHFRAAEAFLGGGEIFAFD